MSVGLPQAYCPTNGLWVEFVGGAWVAELASEA